MKIKSNKHSGLIGVLYGLAASIVFGLLGTALVAYLLGKGNVNAIGIWTNSVFGLSSLIGCCICAVMAKDKIAIYTGICGAAFLFLLVAVNITFFNGLFSGVFLYLVITAVSVLLSVVITGKRGQQKRNKKFKFR